MTKYIITRQGLKSPRSKKLSTIIISTPFKELQEAINACKASNMVFIGTTYMGAYMQYQGDGSTWTILAEITLPNGKTLPVSYDYLRQGVTV